VAGRVAEYRALLRSAQVWETVLLERSALRHQPLARVRGPRRRLDHREDLKKKRLQGIF
jgi:hypothetical protein